MSYAAGYSTLEDAWGLKSHTKRSRRSRKKLAAHAPTVVSPPDMADPICDLYDSKFRRKRRSREGFAPWDSHASIHHPFSLISDAAETLDGSGGDGGGASDDEGDEGDDKPRVAEHQAMPRDPVMHYKARVAPGPSARPHENHDLFMYVFSGVLLLFVLEQFIQVGLHIGVRGVELE